MGWYDALKDAISVADRLRDAELKQRLADVQVECANLAEENARLRQDLMQLREERQVRQEMEYRSNVYWRSSDTGVTEGPFCPKCLDGAGRAARMSNEPGYDYHRCPVCDYAIEKSSVR